MTTLPNFLAGAEQRMTARKAAAGKMAAEAADRNRQRIRRSVPYLGAVVALIIALFVYQHIQRQRQIADYIAQGMEGDGILHPWAERPNWTPDHAPGERFVSYTFDLAANGGRFGGCMRDTEVNLGGALHESMVCVPDRLVDLYRQVGPQQLSNDRPSAYVVIGDGRPCVRISGTEPRRIGDKDPCRAPGEQSILN